MSTEQKKNDISALQYCRKRKPETIYIADMFENIGYMRVRRSLHGTYTKYRWSERTHLS